MRCSGLPVPSLLLEACTTGARRALLCFSLALGWEPSIPNPALCMRQGWRLNSGRHDRAAAMRNQRTYRIRSPLTRVSRSRWAISLENIDWIPTRWVCRS